MKTNKRLIVLLFLLGGVCWFSFAAFRARQDRLSLNFSDAPLEMVVRAIQRQTWEKVLIQPGVTRRITIQVQDVPLAKALDMIAAQAECEWARVYPIYGSGKAKRELRQRIEEERYPKTAWTNYPTRSFRRPGLMPFENETELDAGVHYTAAKKDARQVALDLSRFGKAVVILENGLNAAVNLNLQGVPLDEAVDEFAAALQKKSQKLYVLRPFFKHEDKIPFPPPGLSARSLPPDLEKALASGQPVQIAFEAKDGEISLTPVDGDILALPPLDPVEEQKQLKQKVLEGIRSGTPEQRLERLQQAQKSPTETKVIPRVNESEGGPK